MLRLFWFLVALSVMVGWWVLELPLVAKIPLAILAIPCLVLVIALVDGWLADLLYREPVSRPRLKFHKAEVQTDRVLIYLPGLQNSGRLTIQQYLPTLLKQTNVMVVEDFPTEGFDADRCYNHLIARLMGAEVKNPGLVGMSFGGAVAIDFMRRYAAEGCPIGPISYFVAICVPTDGRDIKSPLAVLTPILKAGPIIRRLYPHLQDLFFALGPKQVPWKDIDPKLLEEHQSYIRNFDARGGFEQVRFIYQAKPLTQGEFGNIPTLILETSGDDVLVKKQRSSPKLRQAFPGSVTMPMPGIHANLVEEFPAYCRAIGGFISRQLART